jgi:diguanylate cyclase (GGDEF)-like protein
MVLADGAVVEIDGTRVSTGIVPSDQLLDVLVPRLARLAGASIVPIAIESLQELGMPAADDRSNASAVAGALFVPLPGRVQGFLLWLRCERARLVRWAGRPEKKLDLGDAGIALSLTPRASFAEWREEERGCCAPWQAWEVATAAELTQAMPEVMQHRAQNRLVRLALHDPLTGLPNRVQLHDQLDKLLRIGEPQSRTSEDGLQLGIMFVDIDRFKAINDTHGHHIGDELLTFVARRISSLIRPQDIPARLGGDEFVVLVPNTNSRELLGIAQRIVDDLRLSFVLGGHVRPGLPVSVGVAIVPKGTEPGEALRQADAAMYNAKRSGRDQIAVYDAALGVAVGRKQIAEQELRRAIDADEITAYYQPIFDLTAGGSPLLHGFEALARWRHPTRGLVPPDQFIGLAEETGLIDALGDAVMLKALRQLRAWPDRRLTMAVNVSVRQLLRPGFADKLVSWLVEFGIEPKRLCLEVTESQMMEKPQLALAALAELRLTDTQIAIDDFGTGFSSMAYVRDLPATLLKIDKLFVAGLPHNRKDVAVVIAILQLAHSLGMRTVAEGVETVEQLDSLRELGSDFAQGYLLGKPSPPEAFIVPATT